MSYANSELQVIEQLDNSSITIGILKCECIVQPLGNNSAAIPNKATETTIFRLNLILAIKVLHK